MIPTVLSQQVADSVRQYLRAAFPMNSPCFEGNGHSVMEQFLNEQENLVKGPYLSVQLPFRQSSVPLDFFPHIRLPFPPYAHQAIAYQRLSGDNPRSTLVATGTGSGKTECFLYPILNHCADNKAPGVKAIIIYPMNALATNQAERFAETVEKNPDLKGKVSVGLFVGSKEDTPSQTMGPKQVITCKDTLRKYPPDILLTNYKMLDYLMLRPEDRQLWANNTPGTLRYLVVDELHTFDGAQGADLGCLIRRLKHRLDVKHDSFACVGTSATVGDDHEELLQYAGRIFDETISSDAIIREDRYQASEYLGNAEVRYHGFPSTEQANLLAPEQFDSEQDYLNQQIALWFEGSELHLPGDIDSEEGIEARTRLGGMLMQHAFFHNFLQLMDNQVRSQRNLNANLYSALSLTDVEMERLIQSFVALICIARRYADETPEMKAKRLAEGKALMVLPFLQVRVQSWLRELRRMVASVSPMPRLQFADDLVVADDERHLAVVHCKDCAATGWASFSHGTDPQLSEELETFYRLFFKQHHSVAAVFPVRDDAKLPSHSSGVIQQLCGRCLNLNGDNQTQCQFCDNTELVRVFRPNMVKDTEAKGKRFNNECPHCQSKNGLSVLGARAATLSSVATHQIFGSRYNENKKLITFSDSVQDAAHRAGFFEARTWPMMIRGTIAGSLRDGDGLTLSEYANLVCNHAKEATQGESDFVARFIAPNMDWLQDYHHMVSNSGALPEGSNLPELVRQRLDWEIYSEFGLKAGIGRTLERTGMATVGVNSAAFQQAMVEAHAQLRNELGQDFEQVTQDQLIWLALGMLHRLRLNGGIAHGALKEYIADKGDTFKFNKVYSTSRYMPNWGKRSRKPRFLTFEKLKAFEQLLGGKKHRTWYQQWLSKTLADDDNVLLSGHEAQIFQVIVRSLVKANVLAVFDVQGANAWALRPEALTVSRGVKALHCTECTESLHVGAEDFSLWEEAPCTSQRCNGHLVAGPLNVDAQWDKSEGYRVVAKEHTGLLERPEREAIEKSFYQGEQAWDINLLSATPTLEMGIDVGDLSSVLLCSVPPAQANYLQRVGRAGRKDGNAYNLTLAQGNAHDQYFYQDPMTMMQGQVTAPGVFLDAPAILERQLTAFFMDSWVNTGIEKSAISQKLGQMLNAVEKGAQQGFPFNFIQFIEAQREPLFERFVSVFDGLSVGSVELLKAFVDGNDNSYSLTARLLDALQLQVQDRKSLRLRADKLKYQIDKLKASPARDKNTDDQLHELETERGGLLALVRKINEQETLNFLTDEGLLPNYAFPEAGVTLRSVLWRKAEKKEEGGSAYVNTAYEYERPASTALSELAPTNHFYAGGHKVEVEQVDLKVSELEDWRLCANCNHSENLQVTGDPNKVCPVCGDPTWADFNQKTRLLKLRQVYARSSMKDSKIGDESENRTPAFFQRQMLVSFQPEAIEKAYHIDNPELPFGFEYLKRATFTDINLGPMLEEATEFKVAGENRKRSGFVVCNDCGMVQKTGEQPKHDLSCRYRLTPESANLEDCLFLYRQLESEAIRILLPVSSFSDDDVTKASLGAALQMGLKNYFHGNVDHLRGLIYQQPEKQDEAHRNYLVIYDSVPGGTGALKDLMGEPEKLLSMLSMALHTLNSCACNAEEDKDGCYRCVYAYRDRGKMKAISRDTARRVLESILSHQDTLKSVDTISSIAINSMVRSELEKKFIETLYGNSSGLVIKKGRVKGQAGWILSSETEPKAIWHMLPQVPMGESEGVNVPSVPDFVIYPGNADSSQKPIVIFLDGFEFHRDIVAEDVAKRRAIMNTGEYLVWTLYWHDLTKPDSMHAKDLLTVSPNPVPFYSDLVSVNLKTLRATHHNRNSYQLLFDLLCSPAKASELYEQVAFGHALSWLNLPALKQKNVMQKFELEMQENATPCRQSQLFAQRPYIFGGLLDATGTSQRLVEVASVLPLLTLVSLQQNSSLSPQERYRIARTSLMLHASFDDQIIEDDEYQRTLVGFWKLVNLAQFLPDFSFVTRRSLVDGQAEQLDVERPEKAASGNAGEGVFELPAEWQELVELELMEESIAVDMAKSGISIPEPGYELAGSVGEAVAMADWAWPGKKIALFDEPSDEAVNFQNQGWKVFTGTVDRQLIDELKEMMAE